MVGRVGVVGVRRPPGRADARFGVVRFGRCDIGEGVCADSLADRTAGTVFRVISTTRFGGRLLATLE